MNQVERFHSLKGKRIKEGLIHLFAEEGDKRDNKGALDIFLKGIEEENCPECYFEAARLYHRYHSHGENFQDYNKAWEFYVKAAELGQPEAQRRIKSYKEIKGLKESNGEK